MSSCLSDDPRRSFREEQLQQRLWLEFIRESVGTGTGAGEGAEAVELIWVTFAKQLGNCSHVSGISTNRISNWTTLLIAFSRSHCPILHPPFFSQSSTALQLYPLLGYLQWNARHAALSSSRGPSRAYHNRIGA